mgnify:CR=1 FL=1
MPHVELKFSGDLDIDVESILAETETIIRAHDDGAGACKGRAYPSDRFHRSHAALRVTLLTKPHRDADFCAALLADLDARIGARIAQPCAFTVELDFFSPFFSARDL